MARDRAGSRPDGEHTPESRPGCHRIASAASLAAYNWGMIPAEVTLGGTDWTTSLWPKGGTYVVPVKTWIRRLNRATSATP